MLAKFANIISVVVIAILLACCIILIIELDDVKDENVLLLKEKAETATLNAELKTKLDAKVVEVVNVPSVEYEEKIIHAKPIIEYVTKETLKVVDNPIYLNICLDSVGLRNANTLITSRDLSYDLSAASEP